MSRYLTCRDLPEVLALRDLAAWSGLSETALLARLADEGDAPRPDGVHAGSPYWLLTSVLRWCPVPGHVRAHQ